MRILPLASSCFAAGVLALALPGCDSNADDRVQLARLSDKCRINSDCSSLLVCVFERCHDECESSRDCDGEARCVQSPQHRNVCQLSDEQACSASGACPGDQVCGIDAECRDACKSDADCLTDQVCSGGTCADVAEINDDGQLEPAPERPTTLLTPCAYDSDCPGREICASGACRAECQDDSLCGEGERCVDQVCEPLPVTRPCLRNSDCDAEQLCRDGQCGPIELEPEPECRFDSDCVVDGQHCDEGECACECSTAADCALGQTCQGGCACTGGRVLDGDVRIGNERELELIRDVAEITGELELKVDGMGEYHLPNLRKVGSLVASSYNGVVWLDGLEEAAGNVRCNQDCRLPRLRRAGTLVLSSQLVTAIELPELETVATDLHIWYSSELTSLLIPKLKSAKNVRINNDAKLEALELPKLTSVEILSIGGLGRLEHVSLPLAAPTYDVEISDNAALKTVALPAMTLSEGRLTLRSNPELETAEFAGLTQVYELSVQLMPKLRTLSLPVLGRVISNFYFSSTAGPETLTLPQLTRVGALTLSATTGIESVSAPLLVEMNDLVINQADIDAVDLPLAKLNGQLSLDANPELSTLELDALTSVDRISLSLLPALKSMNLSALESTNDVLITNTGLTNLTSLYFGAGGALKSAGDLEITYNPSLPVCAITTLTDKLAGQGWAGASEDNNNLQCACAGAVCQ